MDGKKCCDTSSIKLLCHPPGQTGNAIQANMDLKDMEQFDDLLQLNDAYRISRFLCTPTKTWDRTLPNNITLTFGKYTSIVPISNADFLEHYFNFIAYNEVSQRANKSGAPLTYYIGCVYRVSDPIRSGSATRTRRVRRIIDVQNLDGINLPFLIWGEMAESFNMDEYNRMEKPVIIAIASAWATKKYGAEATLLQIKAPNGWYYRKCNECNVKVADDSALSMCHNHGPQPIPNYGYCFKAIINDGTATATVTCFSPEAHTFVPDCNTVANTTEDKDTTHVPTVLTQTEGHTYIFQFRFGQQAKPGFPNFTLDAVLQPVAEPLLALPAAAENIKSPATQVLEEASIPYYYRRRGKQFCQRFDIKKFDGKNDFELWQIKMRALMVQQGCDVALETLPADLKAGQKATLMKRAYSTLILCLGDQVLQEVTKEAVLREVTKETTAAGIWTKLTSLYMTKSLAIRLYLKKKLYTYYMSTGMKLGDHIDEFNKLILDLANIDIEIEDEDQALMLLTSLPSSYENFVETLLYGSESLTMKDFLVTMNSRELKKRTEGTKEETGDGLYVRGRSDHSGKVHSGGSSPFKSRGGTAKLKCFICHSEGHLKRDLPMKKSSGFVKKGKCDQDSNSSDDEDNAYFGEALVVVGNDEMDELVMDSGGSYHMTHRRDFLYDFKVVDDCSVQLGDNRTCTIKGTWKVKIQLHDGSSLTREDVRYVPGLRRSLISLGTLKKEGYIVKMQMGRIKVIKGCRVMMNGIRKKNYVYTLEAKVITFGVQKHGGVHRVQDEKRVWFEEELQGAQGDREAEVFQVSSDDAAVAQRRLEDNQLEEKTNTNCLVKEQEKVYLGIKVGANIMVIRVPGQEDAEGNVAEKRK
ncbi:zinc finger, CCHC-type containing protein [Tanacetum coccineum]